MVRRIPTGFLYRLVAGILLTGLMGCGDDAPDPEGVADGDGNYYPTVVIGQQEWFAENLRTTVYADGSPVSGQLGSLTVPGATEGAYGVYPHDGGYLEGDVAGIGSDEEMVAAYGLLYNWHAVNDSRGLCPDGWRMPGEGDWRALVDYLIEHDDGVSAGNVASSLKSCRQVDSPLGGDCDKSTHPRWDFDPRRFGTDDYGFSALPGGMYTSDGVFNRIGREGAWWSSSEVSSSAAWLTRMSAGLGDVYITDYPVGAGAAVRCMRDH